MEPAIGAKEQRILRTRSGRKISAASARTRFVLALGAFGCFLAVSCDREGPPDHPPEAPPRPPPRPSASAVAAPPPGPSSLRALAREAGLEPDDGTAPDAPRAPLDLAAEVARATSIEACVAAHPVDDAVVADALDALGYDALVRDECRALFALHARRPSACEAIEVSPARARCRADVAALSGDPAACGAAGRREASCTARALRDVRLCGAAAPSERATCRALVLADGDACGGDASCERALARWKPLATPGKAREEPTTLAHADVRVGGATPREGSVDLEGVSEAGAVVRRAGAGLEIVIGAPRTAAWPKADAPLARARLSLVVPIAVKERDGAKIALGAGRARLDLLVPGVASIRAADVESGEVEIVRAPREVASKLALRVSAHAAGASAPADVTLEITTFVREAP